MQNRYFGDVGDFGKYGLLRKLGGDPDDSSLRLGVVWYLFPDEGHNEDGKHITYLQRSAREFRGCDPVLYDKLKSRLVDAATGQIVVAERHVRHAEALELLPPGTLYYDAPLSFQPAERPAARLARRHGWFAGALTAVQSADLVF